MLDCVVVVPVDPVPDDAWLRDRVGARRVLECVLGALAAEGLRACLEGGLGGGASYSDARGDEGPASDSMARWRFNRPEL